MEEGRAPSRRPSVRPCMGVSAPAGQPAAPAGRPAAPPLYTQNTLKRSKPFKINGLGHFWGTHLRFLFYTKIENRAPMQRGVRFGMCPFDTGAFYMGSKQRSKPFKINGLGCFREAFFLGPIWSIQTAKAFLCSVALVFFSREHSHAAWHSFWYFLCSFWCPMLGSARASETL